MIEVDKQKRNAKSQRVKLKTQRKSGRQRYLERSKNCKTKRQVYGFTQKSLSLRLASPLCAFALRLYVFVLCVKRLWVQQKTSLSLRLAPPLCAFALRLYVFVLCVKRLWVQQKTSLSLRLASPLCAFALRLYVFILSVTRLRLKKGEQTHAYPPLSH